MEDSPADRELGEDEAEGGGWEASDSDPGVQVGTASSSGDKSSQEVPGRLDRETIARVVHVCVSVSRNKLMLN